MTIKRAITIGLLSIATIGLIGCAITLNKHKEHKTKTLETNAYSEIDDTIINNEGKISYYAIQLETDNTNTDKLNLVGNVNLRTDHYEISYRLSVTKVDNKTYTTPQLGTLRTITLATNENPTNLYIYRELYTITGSTLRTLIVRYNVVVETNTETTYTSGNQYSDRTTAQPSSDSNNTLITQMNLGTQNTNIIETYQEGYATGYQNKGDITEGNFLSIRNLMLSVLTMPFTFIRQAFNVTMWEGTAYEFNVANFILSLIAIATILFIIRLFTSGFSVIGNYQTNNEKRQLTRSQTQLNKAKTEKLKKDK